MKAFYVMFVVFAVLLLGAPLASAQDGWPGCPWGNTYSPTEHGFIAECFWRPTENGAAIKPAGLAKLAPMEGFVSCGAGENLDLLLDPQALACLSQSIPAAKAASKPAGLAAPAPAVVPDQGWPGCPWGDAYNPMVHGFVSECDIRPADNAASLKTAGLAKLAPAVIPEQGWPGCPWGYGFNPMIHGDVLECLDRPTDNSASPKTAGLAKLAPVENIVPCGFSEQLDPLLDPLALACLSQPFPAAKAASKPAGLAAPAPAQVKFGPCGASGESPDPLTLACLR